VLTILAAVYVSGGKVSESKSHSKGANTFRRQTPDSYNVRSFGAKGDGSALDTDAVNSAIRHASASGGGTIYFPAGTYLCFSIHLQNNIAIYLRQGATILAADPKDARGSYDLPEPNQWDMYQDFGHGHWQNSLIWGIGLENVSILGPGRIDGKGLTRRSPRPRRSIQAHRIVVAGE